jgi:hypothetical protein
MRLGLPPARSAAAAVAALLMLTGCELALHEVQQATSAGCGFGQDACPAGVDYARPGPVPTSVADLERADIVMAAIDAPYRPCNGIGLVCQGRIIGDVLRDQYIMVLAGRSPAVPIAPDVAPDAVRAVPQLPPQPASLSGRIVRTHGSRAGEAPTPASGAPAR